MRRMLQSGQSMSEVLVIAAALAVALFYPYVQGESAATVLVRALLQAMRARSFLVSIL